MTPLLEMNFCPRCGQALEDRFVFRRVRRVCPVCDFVFFREHKVAAAAVVPRGDEILLVRRTMTPGQGKWSIPGGFVEFDEDPREAVAREVLEETGFPVTEVRLLDIVFGQEHPRGATLLIAYEARLFQGGPVGTPDAEEVDAVRFFPLDQLPPIAFKATEKAIELWRARRGATNPAAGSSRSPAEARR